VAAQGASRFNAIFVGAPARREGPAHRARRLAAAAADVPATLTIVGDALDPGLAADVRRAAADDARVRWLGPRPHAWTRQAIRRAHALVVTSRMEGGANVVVEALTSGTPVIGTRMSGNVGCSAPTIRDVRRRRRGRARGDDRPRDARPALARRAGASRRATRQAHDARGRGASAARRDRRALGLEARGARMTSRRTLSESHAMNAPDPVPLRLTEFSHGGGCGCKIAPACCSRSSRRPVPSVLPKELLVGIETADDAAVYRINDRQAIVATTDFFMPIVDDPYDFGAIAATNAISDVYAMGGTPLFALALVGMPVNKLPVDTIRRVLQGGEDVCARAGIPIAGGHTIDSIEPIYGLVAIGLVDPANLKRNAGARPGDRLVLGKPLGVGIYSAALKKQKLDDAGYAAMIASTTKLNTPGIALGTMPASTRSPTSPVRPRGPPARDLPRLGRGRGDRLREGPAASGRERAARGGFFTGASARNWTGYGADVTIDAPGRRPRAHDRHRSADVRRLAGRVRAGRCRRGARGVPPRRVRPRHDIGEIVAGSPRVTVR
jgi:selenide,water dikinase